MVCSVEESCQQYLNTHIFDLLKVFFLNISMAYNLQQSSRMCVVESLLSNYRLVPECHTHPEDQIRVELVSLHLV